LEVLVTGASGFLGGHLARRLLDRGDRVRILARPNSNLEHLRGADLSVIEGSLEDPKALLRGADGVEVIFHAAALSTDWAPWNAFRSVNVDGLKNFLAAAATTPRLRRFVHISSTDVYGFPACPGDEDAPLVSGGIAYAESKILGERLVWQARDEGLPVTVLRPSTIYGPRSKDWVTLIADALKKRTMMFIGRGDVHAGLLYVDNAVDGILAAAESPLTTGKAYNLRDEGSETWRDYVEALAGGLGLRVPSLHVPQGVAFATASALEWAYALGRVRRRPLLTRHLVLLLTRSLAFSIARAQRDFGFATRIRFHEGMARTVAWLRSTASNLQTPGAGRPLTVSSYGTQRRTMSGSANG
jgi:nucleoside-diphosphate-sugar epimerase